MRCPHDQSRGHTKAALPGDVRNCVVFRKQSRSSRQANATLSRARDAARRLRTASGVTRRSASA
jgi:hypothetical protein